MENNGQTTTKYNKQIIDQHISWLNEKAASKAIILCDGDGNLVTSVNNGIQVDLDAAAALMATIAGVGKRISQSLGFGEENDIVLRGQHGILVSNHVTDDLFIGVVAPEDANLAMTGLLIRQTIKKFNEEDALC